MAQQTTEDYLRGQAQQPGRGQQHAQTPGKDQKNKKKEQVDRNSASKEQQQQQQQQQQQRHQLSTAEPLPFGRPRPVRMEPPMILGSFAGRTTAGDTSGGSYEPVTASVAVAHRESDGAPAVPNRNDRTRSCSSQSNSSSSGSISSSGSGGSSDNTSGRGSLSAWEARSKLPFHMLPFEVQAYHLQQLNQPRLHLHNSQNDTGRGSGDGDGESSPPTAPMLPAEEECAVVESAWFPLMPPAMAGEARPASASPSTQRAELGAESDVGPLHADRGSLGLVENGAMTMHAWEWDTREEGHHQRNIVHLMASLSLRRTSLNSTATTNTASTTFATSSTSASSCEGGSEGEAEGPSLPGCSCLPSGSPSAFRPPPTPPRRPDSGAKSTAAAVTVPRARRQDHRSRQRQHPAAEAAVSVLGGGGGDDDVNPKAKTTKAPTCVALSGFVPGGGAAVVQELSLDLSNACRALASWSLTVTQVMAEEEEHSGKLLPARLADHIWPGSSALALRQRGERGGGKDGGQGGGGSQAAGARLEPRRRITRVKVKSDIGVTAASWPSTMRRLEFGGRFNSPVEGIDLPASLEVIRFGDRFNQPVSRVRWPAALLELVFGNDFNQPASGMDLPAGLRRLDFGGRFNFSVSAVDLPEELRELRFGQGFNREISNVRWPPLLSRLDFCGELQQRVEDVAWPGTLRYLALLGDFNQPIDAVKWPAGLTTVRFGDRFQQPLAAAGAARWPPRLERIVLGRGYSKSLSGFVPLPEEDGSACRSLSCARGDGGGGGLSQPVSSRRAPHVVVKCVDDDGDDDDDCGNNGVMLLAREGPLPTVEEDQGMARYAVEMTTAAAAVSAEGERPVLDGGGGDDEHYWDDEEGAEEGERGLPCLDVFGFEDCALDDMGEAWDPCLPPGSYDADDSAGRLGF